MLNNSPCSWGNEKDLQLEIRSRNEMDKYLRLAHSFSNGDFDDDQLYDMYKKGASLWNSLYELWHKLVSINSENARIIRNEAYAKKGAVFQEFLDFARPDGSTGDRRFLICVGEGNSLLEAGQFVEDGDSYDVICGPVMVAYDDTKEYALNDYLLKLIHKDEQLKHLEIYVNQFVSFIPCFAGYFHAYILDDAIFFEQTHRLGDEKDKQGYLLRDKSLVKTARNFFLEYINIYATKVVATSMGEVERYFCTYSPENYRNVFNETYVANILRMVKLEGCV